MQPSIFIRCISIVEMLKWGREVFGREWGDMCILELKKQAP